MFDSIAVPARLAGDAENRRVNMALPYAVEALRPGLPFGAKVVDLKREQLASDEVKDALRDLWIQKGV